MLNKIAESCRFLLDNYPEAQASKSYLDSRLETESQQRWGFGYFPSIQHLSVLSDLVGEETLRQEKLFYSRDIEDSLFPRKVSICFFEDHSLVMPFRDTYGKVVALVGRTLLDEETRKARKLIKYKNTIFTKGNYLFGLYENKQSIIDAGCVYVVEGQFDVIKAVEKGFKNIVALGNSLMTAYQFSVISRYTNNIFLLLDNDEAGLKGRKRIISKFGEYANIRNFYIPEAFKDIDEYITNDRISDYAEMSFLVKD